MVSPSLLIFAIYSHTTLYLLMSPEFEASVENFALGLQRLEFGVNDPSMTPTDKHVLSGVVYGFVKRVTAVAYRYGTAKGRVDASCFAMACKNNRAMFKRMSLLLEADALTSTGKPDLAAV